MLQRLEAVNINGETTNTKKKII